MSDLNARLGLSKEMTAEKNLLMAESSHAFYRATPALFFHDLHTTYKDESQLLAEPAPTVAVLPLLSSPSGGAARRSRHRSHVSCLSIQNP